MAFPVEQVDGNDVAAVRAAAVAAIEAVRAGGGPRLIECKTTRVRGHFEGDPQKYRDPGEFDEIGRKDPLKRTADELRAIGVTEGGDRHHRRSGAKAHWSTWRSPPPAPAPRPRPEAALADVYSSKSSSEPSRTQTDAAA